MSHFARIGENDIVDWVIVAEREFITIARPPEEEWCQTSYNTIGGVHVLGGIPLRKNYAGLGYKYDRVRDAFIPPKPFESWTLNEDTCLWDAPTPMPDDGKRYQWDEGNGWVEVINETV